MSKAEPYSTAKGVESAIKEAASAAARADPSLDVKKRIDLEYFNRFLSRLFSEGRSSEWVLKGGTGMLARVPSTRSTRDIDLYRTGHGLDEALSELRRLAAVDLGDHFRFEYESCEASVTDENQLYTDGYRITFRILIGTAARGNLKVDLVLGTGLTGEVATAEPATALDLPRLVSHPYRLYPVVDQIADKVCAISSRFNGVSSSREKDLVDLVVFATTHEVNGADLRMAIATEARRRRIDPLEIFDTPSGWGTGYEKLSRPVPYCARYPTVESARDLVSRFINPALQGAANDKIWAYELLAWVVSR